MVIYRTHAVSSVISLIDPWCLSGRDPKAVPTVPTLAQNLFFLLNVFVSVVRGGRSANKLRKFSDLPQVWQFVNLLFADPISFCYLRINQKKLADLKCAESLT